LNDTDVTPDRNRVVAALRELVDALDRRCSQVERLGEIGIAREAAALRQEALKRIAELSSAQSNARAEAARSDAEVTDDGEPLANT